MRKAHDFVVTCSGDYPIHTKSNGLYQKKAKQVTVKIEDMEFQGVWKKEYVEIPGVS